MFDKRKESSQEGPRPDFDAGTDAGSAPARSSSSRPAVIGAKIRINGDVSGAEDLVIDGHVDGKVDLGGNRVDVGQTGKVHADIVARVIRIEGEVRGDVNGSEKVTISRTGNVQGNIVAPRLTLEDGAKFKGSIDMDPGDSVVRDAADAGSHTGRTTAKGDSPTADKAAEKAGSNGQGRVPEKSKAEPGLSLKGD